MPKSSSLKRPKNSSDSDSIYKDEFERLQRQNDQLRQALKEKEYEVKARYLPGIDGPKNWIAVAFIHIQLPSVDT